MARIIKKIILHHTASGRDITTLEMVDNWHKARWPNFKSSLGYFVGYHWLIGKDWIKQCRSDQEDGAHTAGFNSDSIGICMTGNFENEYPNQYQLDQLRQLLLTLMGKYGLTENDIYFHRDLTATLCPGKNFTKEMLKNLLYQEPTPTPAQSDKLALLLSELQTKLALLIAELQTLINKYKS